MEGLTTRTLQGLCVYDRKAVSAFELVSDLRIAVAEVTPAWLRSLQPEELKQLRSLFIYSSAPAAGSNSERTSVSQFGTPTSEWHKIFAFCSGFVPPTCPTSAAASRWAGRHSSGLHVPCFLPDGGCSPPTLGSCHEQQASSTHWPSGSAKSAADDCTSTTNIRGVLVLNQHPPKPVGFASWCTNSVHQLVRCWCAVGPCFGPVFGGPTHTNTETPKHFHQSPVGEPTYSPTRRKVFGIPIPSTTLVYQSSRSFWSANSCRVPYWCLQWCMIHLYCHVRCAHTRHGLRRLNIITSNVHCQQHVYNLRSYNLNMSTGLYTSVPLCCRFLSQQPSWSCQSMAEGVCIHMVV